MRKKDIKFMKIAIKISIENSYGPFWAIITKNDKIISIWINKIIVLKDPTAHAEIIAIRNACKNLDTSILKNCIMYTSSEPCSMCLSAIYWAWIKTVFYANKTQDLKKFNFYDSEIYKEIRKSKKERKVKIIQIKNTNAKEAFRKK